MMKLPALAGSTVFGLQEPAQDEGGGPLGSGGPLL